MVGIEVQLDEHCKETRVVIVTNQITDEVHALFKKLTQETGAQQHVIAGMRGNQLTVLDKHDLVRIYALNGKVFAETLDGKYQLRLRLYECEERFAQDGFVRISYSELINLKNTTKFDLSLTGTIRVFF